MSVERIREALAVLDAEDDELWTRDGLPRTEVVAELVGTSVLSRKQITQAAPLFTRSNLVVPEEEDREEPPSLEEPIPSDELPVGAIPEATAAGADSGSDPEPEPEPEPEPDLEMNIEDAVRSAEAEVQEAQSALDAANRLLSEARAKRDRLIEERERSHRDPHGTMRSIQAYLESRNRINVARGVQRARVLASGIKPEDLIPGKAPIDNAMRRQTGFGHSRPTRPAMGSESTEKKQE